MERATANTYIKKSVCLQQPLFITKYSYRIENLAVVLQWLCNVPCQVQSPYSFGCNAAPIKLHGMNIQRKWEFIWSIQGLSVEMMPRNCNLELYVALHYIQCQWVIRVAQLCSSSGSLTRMRGLTILWNFTCSEQISFPWVLAGRISNMVREQWRYRAKDSWWHELQQHGGMQIQMSESDKKWF